MFCESMGVFVLLCSRRDCMLCLYVARHWMSCLIDYDHAMTSVNCYCRCLLCWRLESALPFCWVVGFVCVLVFLDCMFRLCVTRKHFVR